MLVKWIWQTQPRHYAKSSVTFHSTRITTPFLTTFLGTIRFKPCSFKQEFTEYVHHATPEKGTRKPRETPSYVAADGIQNTLSSVYCLSFGHIFTPRVPPYFDYRRTKQVNSQLVIKLGNLPGMHTP